MTRSALMVSCWVAASLLTQPAKAQPVGAPVDATKEAAADLYEQARQAYDAGELENARAKIEASIAAMPSPNSELLLGHILRALGHKVDAILAYERAAAGAKARVVQGQSRFEPTVAEASKWSGLLGASLAALEIELVGDGPQATVRVGQTSYVLRPAPQGPASMSLWLEPGDVAIEVVRGEQRTTRSLSLAAGSSQQLSFELAAPRALGIADRSYAPPIGTWVSFGVGALGLGTFAALGAWTLSVDAGLEACSPTCPPDRREEADLGESLQIGANVGAAIGGAALLVGVILWIVDASTEPEDPLAPKARAGGLELRF